MDLAFTDEQDMLRDAVRGLCADAADTVRSLEDDPKGYDDGFWNQLATMGLTGLMLTEQHGGSAMGLLDAVVVYEEFGRSLVPSPHLASSVVAAGRLVVVARTGDDVDLYLVDPAADGVSLTLQQTVAGDTQYRVDLDGVRIPTTNRIGDSGTGWDTWHTVMLDTMVLVAALAIGAAQATHALTTDYARERHQFDKPIGSFQSISHYLSDGITAIEGGRVLVHQAAWARDQGRDVTTLAPMAKLFATQTCRDVTGVAIQVHGGMGFTVECDAQLYFRRAKSWQLNWVGPERLEELIAAGILD